jgi:hypothetical protein
MWCDVTQVMSWRCDLVNGGEELWSRWKDLSEMRRRSAATNVKLLEGGSFWQFELFLIVLWVISITEYLIIEPLPDLRPTEVKIQISLRQFQFKVGPIIKMSLHVHFELRFSISLRKLFYYY